MAGYGLFRPFVKRILLMIEAVLLYYDYLLTLPDEVDRLWHRRPYSWASIVFFANRYIALLGHVPFVYSVYADPCKMGVSPILRLLSAGDLFFYFEDHVSLFVTYSWAHRHTSTRSGSLFLTNTMAH